MDWPAALYAAIEDGIRQDVLMVCVSHKGAHVFYLDGCHALPPRRAPFTDPMPRCQEDGTCRLAAGTHVHAPPTKIEIDVDGLAEAIVRASRAAREERRPIQPAVSTPPAQTAAPTAQSSEPSIPTVTVWSPGMDDGRSD